MATNNCVVKHNITNKHSTNIQFMGMKTQIYPKIKITPWFTHPQDILQ